MYSHPSDGNLNTLMISLLLLNDYGFFLAFLFEIELNVMPTNVKSEKNE